MELKPIQERQGWQQRVEDTGLVYHSAGGAYWDETHAFFLSEQESVELDNATQTLIDMMIVTAKKMVVEKPEFLLQAFDKPMVDVLIADMLQGHLPEYGRYDFGMVNGMPKMFEYNADTPVCLIEGSWTQWDWFTDMVEAGQLTDLPSPRHSGHYQMNSIYERLMAMFSQYAGKRVLVTCCKGPWLEYEATALYMIEVAKDSGCNPVFRWVEDLELDLDTYEIVEDGQPFDAIVKLYPSEWFVKDLKEAGMKYPEKLLTSNNFIERPWKLLIGGKFMLAELYKDFPECPWLIPAWHTREECLDKKVVAKSWYGRIGTEVEILDPYQRTTLQGPVVYQLYQETDKFGKDKDLFATIGAWHIHGAPAGIGIRAQKTEVTKDDCLFFPHVVDYQPVDSANS